MGSLVLARGSPAAEGEGQRSCAAGFGSMRLVASGRGTAARASVASLSGAAGAARGAAAASFSSDGAPAGAGGPLINRGTTATDSWK